MGGCVEGGWGGGDAHDALLPHDIPGGHQELDLPEEAEQAATRASGGSPGPGKQRRQTPPSHGTARGLATVRMAVHPPRQR